jgi:flagellar hook-associated protein 3 FlgL
MTGISVGDMAQQFTSMRNGGVIKTDLARLAESLSTGKVADITKELGGETKRFSGIKYSLTQLDAYQKTSQETAQTLANIQTVLSKVDEVRGTSSQRLLLVNDSSTIAQIDEAAQSSRSAFETVVRTLNTQIADRSLLGGASVGQPPLAAAADMMGALNATLVGITDPAIIISMVDDWFDDVGGGFETLGYLGDTGPLVQKQISDTQTIELSARANDPAIRDVLKGSALAALASELPAMDRDSKMALLEEAGARLFDASSNLVAVQARVGFTEMLVSDAIAQNVSQETSLSILRNDLIAADPFDTASKLQAVQLQLETHFTVTARMSQLSLLRYI